MQKTKIEWTDYVWNPIKGLCPVDCWYCYARKIYERFGWDTELSWDGRVPILSNKKPSRIFICSTMEMFHPDIPKEWRDRIFKIIKADYNKKHTFQVLTKLPENIDREMPENVWLGVTTTGEEGSWERTAELHKVKAKLKFISYEPMLEQRIFDWDEIDWLILGRLTGYGKKHDPPRDWIKSRIRIMKNAGIPIFLKNNLKSIWGENLIQEMPNERNT